MSEKQEYKKDTRLDMKKTERSRELRVSQTLEEKHRRKVTRLEKGLGRQNSISFSSLLALVFQSGRKYLKAGRQARYNLETRLPLLSSALESCLLPNTAPRNLHGLCRERLLLTHTLYFAGILLTLFHM